MWRIGTTTPTIVGAGPSPDFTSGRSSVKPWRLTEQSSPARIFPRPFSQTLSTQVEAGYREVAPPRSPIVAIRVGGENEMCHEV